MFYVPLLLGWHQNAVNRCMQWFIIIRSQSGIKNFINFLVSVFCSQGNPIMHQWLSSPSSLDAQIMKQIYLSRVWCSVEPLLRHGHNSFIAAARVYGIGLSSQVEGKFQGHINLEILYYLYTQTTVQVQSRLSFPMDLITQFRNV